jgi:hypothetical protein
LPGLRETQIRISGCAQFGVYEGTLARAVLLLKHEHIEPLGNWFAEQLAGLIGKESEQMAADTDSEAVSAD